MSDVAARVPMFSRAIPALPVVSVAASSAWYCDRLGFVEEYVGDGLAVLRSGDAVLHLWQAGDTTWSDREDLVTRPIASGAESFLAGTASCRIETDEIDALFADLCSKRVLHFSSQEVVETGYGAREFHVSDPDCNLVTFVQVDARDN